MNTTIPKPRRHLLSIAVPIVLLLAVAALLLSTVWSSLVPAPSVSTVAALLREVETEQVEDLPLDEAAVVQAPGWVEAEPWSVYVGALTEGVIETILVLEGDTVKKGQAVARLVDDEARIGVMQTEAMVRTRQAEAMDAEAQLDVLAAQLVSARASTDALIDEHVRKLQLVEEGAVAAGPVKRLGLRIRAAEADIKKLEAQRHAAGAALAKANAAIESAAATRDLAALKLNRMTVISPMDGVVIERLASPGSVIRFGNGEHGSHIVHLYDPKRLQVRADVPLADVAMVGRGQPAEIVVDLLPDTVFTGEVLRFVHKADLQKNTVEAKVRINNPSPLLKPDMLARVKILPAPITGADGVVRQRLPRVLVPEEAIADGWVWVVEGDDGTLGTARRRAVRIGSGTHEGWVEVLEGVRPGDRVILNYTALSDGDVVRATPKEGAS
jgi:RND family efflux transporter MFP subunit